MPRLAPLDLNNLTAEQKVVADAIVSGPRGGLRGPFEAWLRSPGLADPAQKLGEYIRFGSSLPRDLSELAIIIAGKRWRSQYEFWAHSRMAKEAGLSQDVIDAIAAGTPPPFKREEERVIYDFLGEFFATNAVSDGTYARALAAFGENGVVDMIGAAGYYTLVSMTLNVFQVALPEGVTPPLP